MLVESSCDHDWVDGGSTGLLAESIRRTVKWCVNATQVASGEPRSVQPHGRPTPSDSFPALQVDRSLPA